MKIIFSRKGFDAENGGVASPIFPDGGLRSLPIPSLWDQKHPQPPRYKVTYHDLSNETEDLGSVVEELSFNHRKRKPRIKRTDFCHLDPDLIRGDLDRKAGWVPMFGQSGKACAHLLNHGVRESDLFLFFRWFHRLQEANGHFKFDPEGQDAHVIFGWLQVGEVWCRFNADSVLPKWARGHSHVRGDTDGFCNLTKPVDAVFVARRRLELPGLRTRLPGGGVFREYHKKLQLTEPGGTRRNWRLPAWMYPFPDKRPLSHHKDKKRWGRDGRWATLRTVDIGQEFVLDTDYYPKASEWLAELFRAAA